jgi:hypothetical protein
MVKIEAGSVGSNTLVYVIRILAGSYAVKTRLLRDVVGLIYMLHYINENTTKRRISHTIVTHHHASMNAAASSFL